VKEALHVRAQSLYEPPLVHHPLMGWAPGPLQTGTTVACASNASGPARLAAAATVGGGVGRGAAGVRVTLALPAGLPAPPAPPSHAPLQLSPGSRVAGPACC
jgi:hypothetical protein